MANPVDDLSPAPRRRGWLLHLFEAFLVCGALACGATYWWLRHGRNDAAHDPRTAQQSAANRVVPAAPAVLIPTPKPPAKSSPSSRPPADAKKPGTETGSSKTPVAVRDPSGSGSQTSQPSQTEPVRTASRDPFASPSPAKSGATKTTGPSSSGPRNAGPSGIARLPDLADRDRTSWQDPFEARLWQVSGWSFGADGMRPTAAEGTATFHRRYRRLMLDVEIASRDAESAPLELRWVAPATGAEGRVRIAADGIELVVPDTDGSLPGEGRKADFETPLVPGQAGRLRFGATGNRLLVHWNERRVASCDQPVAQLGRELEFSWIGSTGSLRIVHLRVEGE